MPFICLLQATIYHTFEYSTYLLFYIKYLVTTTVPVTLSNSKPQNKPRYRTVIMKPRVHYCYLKMEYYLRIVVFKARLYIVFEGGRARRPWTPHIWNPKPRICRNDLQALRGGPRTSQNSWNFRAPMARGLWVNPENQGFEGHKCGIHCHRALQPWVFKRRK